jgi:hypothetical protein
MEKGYQLIETELTDKVIKYLPPDLKYIVFEWALSILREECSKENLPIEIDIVNVKYESKYIAFGIYYLEQNGHDYGEYIEEKVENIFYTNSLISYSINNHKLLKNKLEIYREWESST